MTCHVTIDQGRLLVRGRLRLCERGRRFGGRDRLGSRGVSSLGRRGLRTRLDRGSRRLVHAALGVIHGGRVLVNVGGRMLNVSRSVDRRGLISLQHGALQLLKRVRAGVRRSSSLRTFRDAFSSICRSFFEGLRRTCPRLGGGSGLLYTCVGVGLLSGRVTPLLGVSLHKIRVDHCHLQGGLNLRRKRGLTRFLREFGG